ncbi:hypothetical protein CHH28_03285 [Bacterioplanes sanyensis]|uniref:Imelysin-like domain-containing protein n=1 Tax=Bacterioplanes sanyensis TaxID=1249553 RepID=A0A222FF94_9GAMM|nr:imelysin family protein [Bacterioplanes sanyensis]ASP37755.1 hypothetical protein CHH28_03285 [Bacterioplanes sanyensis]
MTKRWCIPLLTLWIVGCDQTPTAPTQVQTTTPQEVTRQLSDDPALSSLRADLGLMAYTRWSQASQAAQQLDSRIAALLHTPNDALLAEARQAWRQAYSAYLGAQLFTQLPINDPPDWHRQRVDKQSLQERLDSWPIEPGYIDYLPNYPFSGIVNDLALELTPQTLLEQHGFSDASSASLGYHPIEFMLWGDQGVRSAKDFYARANTIATVASVENDQPALPATDRVQNHHRRREYLALVSDQLQKDLQRIQRRWQPSEGYYAQALNDSRPEQLLSATLMAAQRLVSQQLLQQRLDQHSSEFSMTSLDDLQALTDGVFSVIIPGEPQQGLNPLLEEAERQQWQHLQQHIDGLLQQWRGGELLSQDAREQLREAYITLLSQLQRSASSLGIALPAAG